MPNLKPIIVLITTLPLAGCDPPSQTLLEDCRKVANERAIGHSLTADDLGELTEACMAERGFLLHKQDRACSHTLTSQSQRRCYFPNTVLGRIHRRFIAD